MFPTSRSLSGGGTYDVDDLSISERKSVETLEVLSVSSDRFSNCTYIQQSVNCSLLPADSELVETTDASVEVCLDSESGIAASLDTVESRQEGGRRRGLCAFFQKTWRTLKRPFRRNRVEPIVPPLRPETDACDPEKCGSDLSSMKPSPTDTVRSSITEHHTNGSQRNGLCAFFQKTWKAVKCPFLRSQRTRVEPIVPPLETHASETQLTNVWCGSSRKQTPDRGSDQDSLLILLDETLDTDLSGSELSPDTELAYSELPSVLGDVKSQYTVECLLGSGCFGAVYQGTRKSDGQKVAIKFIAKWEDDRYLYIPGHSEPLLTEVALMLLMSQTPISPYVIQLYDWFEEPKTVTIIMEFPQPCKSLNDFIVCHERLSEEIACVLMRQAVLAVQHCIQHGVFHTDIHPDNILVNPDTLQLKLIDFGCGQLFSSTGYQRSQYRGATVYCPPEVSTKPSFHATPANVWSLGVVLYEMVNGCLPFRGTEKVLFVNPKLSRGQNTGLNGWQ